MYRAARCMADSIMPSAREDEYPLGVSCSVIAMDPSSENMQDVSCCGRTMLSSFLCSPSGEPPMVRKDVDDRAMVSGVVLHCKEITLQW